MTTKRELLPPVSPTLERVHGIDRNILRIQENVARATKESSANPENRGRLVTGVVITETGDIFVNHLLGRKPRGWTVRKVTAGTPKIVEKTATSRFLVLNAATVTAPEVATGTVDLWVF